MGLLLLLADTESSHVVNKLLPIVNVTYDSAIVCCAAARTYMTC